MAVDFKKLIEAGVPFGHPTASWNPKMAPYIWGRKNKVYLINVLETARLLEKAAQFLTSLAAENKTILWVGTKKVARPIIAHAAQETNSPYVSHRWIGGSLTNFVQIKKPIAKLQHLKEVLSKTEHEHYTKKEMSRLHKEADRLENNFGGIVNLKWPIGALVIVDVRKEQAALKEAASVGIPVVGLVDTNSNPELVQYVIPGNDDGRDSISIIVDYLAQAVKKGKEIAKEKGVQAEAAEAEQVQAQEIVSESLEIEDESETTDLLKASKVKRFKDSGLPAKSDAGRKKISK